METQTTQPADNSQSFANQIKQVIGSPKYRMSGGDFDMKPASATAAPAAPELPVGEPQKVEPAKETKVKLNGKEFSDIQEAILYAEKSLAKSEGLQEAIEKLGKKDAAPAAPTEEPDYFKELEDEIFLNPKEALRKLYEKAKADAESSVYKRYDERVAQENAEKQREAAWNKTWEGFYADNKDLAEARELVDYVVERKWKDISELPLDKALKMVADETRRIGKINREAALPAKTLQPGPAIMASSTPPTLADSTPAAAKSALDFISQVNKHRRRGK